jgi:hypothetical protein
MKNTKTLCGHRRIVQHSRRLALLGALLAMHFALPASAVMLLGSGDPEANTTPPTGTLEGSGWQYQGQWGGVLGTVIGPQYFIAARHVGGAVGQKFVFNGTSYVTTASWDDPSGSDLRIWKVDGYFPTWAPLYSNNDELGKPLVVIGRGTQRGDEVIVETVQTNTTTTVYTLKDLGIKRNQAEQLFPGATLKGNTLTVVTSEVVTNDVPKGWKNGLGDGRMRWGENQVSGAGDLLVASFDATGGPNQAFLSGGDSSGAVFMQEAGMWKLAGINYAIEGPYKIALADSEFFGAFFDTSGLYTGSTLIPMDGQVRPTRFYATRISARLTWIHTILSQ